MTLLFVSLFFSALTQLPHLRPTLPSPSASLFLFPPPSCLSSLEHLSLTLLQSILSWLAFAPSALPAGGVFGDWTPHLTHGELLKSQGAPGHQWDEAEIPGDWSSLWNSDGAILSLELCGTFLIPCKYVSSSSSS